MPRPRPCLSWAPRTAGTRGENLDEGLSRTCSAPARGPCPAASGPPAWGVGSPLCGQSPQHRQRAPEPWQGSGTPVPRTLLGAQLHGTAGWRWSQGTRVCPAQQVLAAGKPLPHCQPQARLSPVTAVLHSHLTGLGASHCHQLSFRQATAPPLAQPSRRLKHMHKLNRHPDSTDIQSNLNDIH